MGEFRMPSLGADMDVGTIVEWLVKPGDAVRRGQIVAVVDTAKAAIEIEAFEEGVITEILIGTGVKVPVGTPLAMIGASAPASLRGADDSDHETVGIVSTNACRAPCAWALLRGWSHRSTHGPLRPCGTWPINWGSTSMRSPARVPTGTSPTTTSCAPHRRPRRWLVRAMVDRSEERGAARRRGSGCGSRPAPGGSPPSAVSTSTTSPAPVHPPPGQPGRWWVPMSSVRPTQVR